MDQPFPNGGARGIPRPLLLAAFNLPFVADVYAEPSHSLLYHQLRSSSQLKLVIVYSQVVIHLVGSISVAASDLQTSPTSNMDHRTSSFSEVG